MSDTAKHTPEPWIVNPEDIGLCVFGSGDRMVGKCFEDGESPDAEDDANARRIVACVNACAGTPTEWLEQNRPIYLVGPPASQSLELMRKQRDQLAEACRGLLRRLISHQNVHCKTVLSDDVDALRDALAKVSA